MHTRIRTGSSWEDRIGYCRAVVAGDTLEISATSASDDALSGDLRDQTLSALARIQAVIVEAGFALSDVTRTRLYVSDFENWELAAAAHGEVFADIRPAFTILHVLPFVDPAIGVEVEVSAIRQR